MDMMTSVQTEPEDFPEYDFPRDLYAAILEGKKRAAKELKNIGVGKSKRGPSKKLLNATILKRFHFLNWNLINFYGHNTMNESPTGGRMHLRNIVAVYAQNYALFSALEDPDLAKKLNLKKIWKQAQGQGREKMESEAELLGQQSFLTYMLGHTYGIDLQDYKSFFRNHPVHKEVIISLMTSSMRFGEDVRECLEAIAPDSFAFSERDLQIMIDKFTPRTVGQTPDSDDGQGQLFDAVPSIAAE